MSECIHGQPLHGACILCNERGFELAPEPTATTSAIDPAVQARIAELKSELGAAIERRLSAQPSPSLYDQVGAETLCRRETFDAVNAKIAAQPSPDAAPRGAIAFAWDVVARQAKDYPEDSTPFEQLTACAKELRAWLERTPSPPRGGECGEVPHHVRFEAMASDNGWCIERVGGKYTSAETESRWYWFDQGHSYARSQNRAASAGKPVAWRFHWLNHSGQHDGKWVYRDHTPDALHEQGIQTNSVSWSPNPSKIDWQPLYTHPPADAVSSVQDEGMVSVPASLLAATVAFMRDGIDDFDAVPPDSIYARLSALSRLASK